MDIFGSAFKDLFKRKEGGTVVGNLLRGALNNVSGGLLGNGVFMLKDGQTEEQNQKQIEQAVINGIIAANATNTQNNMLNNLTNWVKTNKLLAAVIGVGIAVAAYFIFKPKKVRYVR